MNRKTNIKKFLFSRAQYRICDDRGNELLLSINYTRRIFKITGLKSNDDGVEKLKDQAQNIANDLIERKSNVNFAQRVGSKMKNN